LRNQRTVFETCRAELFQELQAKIAALRAPNQLLDLLSISFLAAWRVDLPELGVPFEQRAFAVNGSSETARKN